MPLCPQENLLCVDDKLRIPLADFDERYIRASGPGGQHVNKTSSAVQLRFDVRGCTALGDGVRARLTRLAGNRLTRSGELVVTAQRFRSREQNRNDAYDRIERLIQRALKPPKKRKRTKPSRAARQRRLDDKKRRGAVKRMRGKPARD